MNGRSVSLLDLLKLKSTWPRKAAMQVAHMKRLLTEPPGDCNQKGASLLGTDVLMGEQVSEVAFEVDLRSGTTAAASSAATCCGGRPVVAERLTTWRAPRLGCEPLKYQVEAAHPDGGLDLVVTGNPTRLDLGEPEARWFDEGADYSEGKPSELQTKFLQQMGIAEDDQMRGRALKLDERYQGCENQPCGSVPR
jgi:hypothetical protein